MDELSDMRLYVLPGCPFCAKVDRFLDAHHVDIPHFKVTEGTNAADLKAVGGKVQSPCLVHDGVALYESDDIIAFVAKRIGAAPDVDGDDAPKACPINR